MTTPKEKAIEQIMNLIHWNAQDEVEIKRILGDYDKAERERIVIKLANLIAFGIVETHKHPNKSIKRIAEELISEQAKRIKQLKTQK